MGRALQPIPGALALFAVVLTGGCYSTTPHRVEITSRAEPRACAEAVADVFARSGYIQLGTPTWLSMFFAQSVGSAMASFGVGVTIDATNHPGTCHVTLEALSPDPNCVTSDPSGLGPAACELSYAPGNEATIDELARRVRERLGLRASVN